MSANLARRALIALATLIVLGSAAAPAAAEITASHAPHAVTADAAPADNTPWD